MIRPFQDNVILKLLPLETMSAGGLHLVHKKDPGARASRWARVIASGPGYRRQTKCKLGDRVYTEDSGVFVKNQTREGDLVLIDETSGQDYAFDLNIPRANAGADFEELVGERGQFRVVREDEIHLIAESAEAAE